MTPRRCRGSVVLRVVPVLLGLAGLIGAIVLGAMHGRFEWYHLATAGVSVATVFGGLLWQQDASWRDTLASIAYSFFFAVAAMFCYLIAANREWRIDFTRERLFSLTPQTELFLRDLPRDTQMSVVALVNASEHAELERFLDQYRLLAPPGVRFQALDPDTDLAHVREIEPSPLPNDLIVILHGRGPDGGPAAEKARRKFKIPASGAQRERVLTNAIADVALGRDRRLYFTTGHGERRLAAGAKDSKERREQALTKWAELLNERALPVAELRVLEGVPDDAAAVVVAGPVNDFFDYERDVLIDYVRSGGKLFVMIDPQLRDDAALPNFARVLEAAGLRSQNFFLVDPLSAAATRSNFTPLVRAVGEHPIAKSMPDAQILMNVARPVDITSPVPEGAIYAPLLLTNERCFIQTVQDLRTNPRNDPPRGGEGVMNYPMAIAGIIPTPQGTRGEAARVVIVGDSDMFTDALLENDSAVFGVQSVNWLVERDSMLDIPPRLVAATPVRLTTTHVLAMGGSFLAIGLALGAGGLALTLARRRRR